MSPIFIQAIGFVGVLFFIISYQIKSNKMLFLMQMLGTAMFCCQFLLLGATSGAANLIGIIVRNALLMKCRDWNAQKIRLGNLICGSPCWLIYDALIGSWAGVLNESITLGSILVSIWRYGWKAMGKSDSGF